MNALQLSAINPIPARTAIRPIWQSSFSESSEPYDLPQTNSGYLELSSVQVSNLARTIVQPYSWLGHLGGPVPHPTGVRLISDAGLEWSTGLTPAASSGTLLTTPAAGSAPRPVSRGAPIKLIRHPLGSAIYLELPSAQVAKNILYQQICLGGFAAH